MTVPRVVVVGAGIAGLSCAFDLITHDPSLDVVVLEADGRTGGKIHTTPFAGLAVDEAADAFLARVPWAHELCAELDLASELTSPASNRAYLYSYGALRRIPADNVLGVPLDLDALAASGIVSDARSGPRTGTISIARATTSPIVSPRPVQTSRSAHSSAGVWATRSTTVSSIRSSAGSTQGRPTNSASRAPLRSSPPPRRSTAASSARSERHDAEPPSAEPTPVFYSHPRGVGYITDELQRRLGSRVQLSTPVRAIERDGAGYRLHTAQSSSDGRCHRHRDTDVRRGELARTIASPAADLCARIDYSSVVLITFAVAKHTVEHPLDGSGFLVPKCEDRFITACSWTSSKWAHLTSDRYAITARVDRTHRQSTSAVARRRNA